jgi:hypothetical protein
MDVLTRIQIEFALKQFIMKFVPSIRDDFYLNRLQWKKEKKFLKKGNKKFEKFLRRHKTEHFILMNPNKLFHKKLSFHRLIVDFCLYTYEVNFLIFKVKFYGFKWWYMMLDTPRYFVFDYLYYGKHGVPPINRHPSH